MTPLGSSNLADPAVLPTQPIPYGGGQYKSGILSNQTIITGDTFHFNDQWAVQASSARRSCIQKVFRRPAL